VERVEGFDKKSREARKPLEFSADAGEIKIEGIGIYGRRYRITSDGKTVTVTTIGFDDKEKIEKDLKLDIAIAGVGGKSNKAATVVPNMLLDIRYGNVLTSLDSPHLEETQQYMKKSGIKSITTLQMIGIEEAQ
jgi:hypothetical protein